MRSHDRRTRDLCVIAPTMTCRDEGTWHAPLQMGRDERRADAFDVPTTQHNSILNSILIPFQKLSLEDPSKAGNAIERWRG